MPNQLDTLITIDEGPEVAVAGWCTVIWKKKAISFHPLNCFPIDDVAGISSAMAGVDVQVSGKPETD